MMVDNRFTGPSSDEKMAKITVKGNSYERGFQYGRELKQYLRDFYYWFVKAEPAEVLTREYRKVLDQMEEVTAKHFPQLLEQVKGWSDGAEMDYDKCRIMTFHNDIKRLAPGCSNVLVTDSCDGAWLARNCDLLDFERSWQIFVKAYCDDCYSYAGTGYVGLPGSIGVNQEGLAIGGSSLPCAPASDGQEGLPNYIYYLIQTQDSVASCRKTIESVPNLCGGGHWLMLDSSGNCVAVEIGGGRHFFREAEENGFLVATNNSATGKMPLPDKPLAEYLENSRCRYDRLCEIIGNAKPEERGISLGCKAMGDHEGKWSVCEHVPNGFHTIYSWVVKPGKSQSEMHLCWGYPCSNDYERIDIEW